MNEWVKSSYSDTQGGSNCIEWAPAAVSVDGVVPVRDSKDPNGPVLTFAPDAFADFVSAVAGGQFSN